MKLQKDFSPFLRLYKYRPTIKNTPRENFVTESFALCLFYNSEITKLFLKEFLNITTDNEITIDTQVVYKDSIFDLTLTDTLIFHVSVECKMGAGVGKQADRTSDQLDRYISHLKEFQIKNKNLLLVDIGNLTIKDTTDVNYKATRWNDIKIFLEKQTGKTEIGELLRVSFLDLLSHLKVDRKLINGRLSWKCDLCGSEMIGQGIYSHRKKHERELKYRSLIDDKNNNAKNEFDKLIAPYQDRFKSMKERIKNIGKIEKNNFSDAQEVTKILEEYLPKNIWIYFINQIKYCFSNKAYLDYRSDIIRKLNSENENYIEEPQYLSSTYENIVRLVNGQ